MASILPVCVDDFENLARHILPLNYFRFYADGADDMTTLQDNTSSFSRIILRPRVLRDVASRDLSTTILGEPVSYPVAIAPSALHGLANLDGEIATAKAAASANTGMVLSIMSSRSMEDVAQATPNGLRWFNIIFFKDHDIMIDLIRRAERSGYKALFVTLDIPVTGKRRRCFFKNNFQLPFCLGNFQDLAIRTPKDSRLRMDESVTWATIDWIRSLTTLPIVAKGILTAKDAREAVKHGISGIVVSNHGGRQLDGVIPTIDALSDVVEAVRGSGVEVYMDGGVRKGTDVLKALALGARAVFVGRPVIWGLAYNGEEGVKNVLEILRDEFDRAMALSGCRSVDEITGNLVRRRMNYSSKL